MKSFREVVSSKDGKSQCLFVIENSLQAEDIDGLKQPLFRSVESYATVQIVLRKLEALELPALQWIMAFQRAAQTEGKHVLLHMDLAAPLQTMVNQSGLFRMFNYTDQLIQGLQKTSI